MKKNIYAMVKEALESVQKMESDPFTQLQKTVEAWQKDRQDLLKKAEEITAEPLKKTYASDAQRKWAHTAEGTKALGGKAAVKEWDAKSKGKDLPARALDKVDPKSHLPGVLLDKNSEPDTLYTTTDMHGYGKQKVPVNKSDSIKRVLKKCNGLMKSDEKGVNLKAATHPKLAGMSDAGKHVRYADNAMRRGDDHGQSLFTNSAKVKQQKTLADLKAMPKPNLPKSECMQKDDKPHPMGSPEDVAHDIAEGKSNIPQSVAELRAKDKIKKMFDHLRSKKDNPNWDRSEKNKKVGEGNENG